MAQNITLLGASYSAVPAVQLPKTGGGTATFTDVTDTTAAAADVASGKYFYTSAGVRTQGTNSGGGGSSKNAQVVQQSNTRINTTTYTKASGEITVSKTGTYHVYWTAYKTSSSGSWGTQLYIDGEAYGSAQTSFTSSYYQAIHLSNVSLTSGDKISVYGKSRGSNYYLYVGQLTIIES